jgi:hypothetical protein
MDTDTFIDKFPLLKYVERYEVDLEEKDILYNPMSIRIDHFHKSRKRKCRKQ